MFTYFKSLFYFYCRHKIVNTNLLTSSQLFLKLSVNDKQEKNSPILILCMNLSVVKSQLFHDTLFRTKELSNSGYSGVIAP